MDDMIHSSTIQQQHRSILVTSLALFGAVVVVMCQFYPDLTSAFSHRGGENKNKDPNKNDRKEKINDETVDDDDDVVDVDVDIDVDGSDTENGLDDGDNCPKIDHYFPWEPNYEPKAKSKIDESSSKPRNSLLGKHNVAAAASTSSTRSSSLDSGSKTRTTKQCTEDLNFLATMTFANGGLRSPSCPCCI